MIADVVPEKRAFDRETYSYLVPNGLVNSIKIGSICHIPFGKKTIRGVITRIQMTDNSYDFQQTGIKPSYKLKEILNVSDIVIPQNYIEIAKWVSEYYLCSLGEAISLFLPPDLKRKSKIEAISTAEDILPELKIKLSDEQNKVFEKIKDKLIYYSSTLRQLADGGSRTNDVDSSQSTLSQSNNKPALLFGVTGSGKTEIYLKLVYECLKLKKQAIILVPEIMLTPQVVEKFEKYFPDQVALYHSQLTQSEKLNSYREFYLGKKNIIIGPRSALLIPSNNIGLIIIDEEGEDAYKQESAPRYHAVTLAEEIAKMNNSLLVLGSATPRIETYYKTKNNLYDIFILKNRYCNLILPTAEVIDLKYEIKKDNFSPISEKLQEMIAKVLSQKKQILLFLNRRGMSTFVSCRDCGYIATCPRCNIPLVYHLNEITSGLNCHHCNYTAQVPAHCPDCDSLKIKFFGAGIEKIENEIMRLFPKARIKTIESKTIKNTTDLKKLHADLNDRKIDILIGTQILAKGLDLENVDLVGIISADVGMHMPYFRAMEKTFQIITQVSGRSGRKHNVGQTIIQTYWPDSQAITLAATHDFEAFYKLEIETREKLNYPPFCHIIRIVSENQNEALAKKEIDKVAQNLRSVKINFIGPGKCFFSKLHNRFRYHLIIKTKKWPNETIISVFKQNPYLLWDAEPVDLL